MRKATRIVLISLPVIALVTLLLNYRLIGYGLMQLRGQLTIVMGSRPVEEVMKDPAITDSIKSRLELIQHIRQFAFGQLGMELSDNYTTYFEDEEASKLWVLTASAPYKLEAYQWKFPFIGEVSYKGFFNKKQALKELEVLKEKGYDTDLGLAGGWSTLGWFTDPVLPGMLKRNTGDLANLIIHELTHQTLFVKDSVDFNENLASFVGDKGARLFLDHHFGPGSAELLKYEQSIYDDSLFAAFMVDAAQQLDSFYLHMPAGIPKNMRESLKYTYIDSLLVTVTELPLFDPPELLSLRRRGRENGNAFFQGFLRYNAKQDQFQHELDSVFRGDLKAFITAWAARYPSL